MCSSSLLGVISSPRSAPACSMAARMSLSMSFSRTISPETACDTLSTVARSSCRRLDRARWIRGALLLLQTWMELIELPHLSFSSPSEIVLPCVCQVEMCDFLEAARWVEACGKFVGESLVLNEPVLPGEADRLLVQAFGVKRMVIDAGGFRQEQRVAIAEGHGTVLRPVGKLP